MQIAGTPYAEVGNIDSTACHHWAMQIAAGASWPDGTFYQSPFYAYFLAVLMLKVTSSRNDDEESGRRHGWDGPIPRGSSRRRAARQCQAATRYHAMGRSGAARRPRHAPNGPVSRDATNVRGADTGGRRPRCDPRPPPTAM